MSPRRRRRRRCPPRCRAAGQAVRIEMPGAGTVPVVDLTGKLGSLVTRNCNLFAIRLMKIVFEFVRGIDVIL